MHCFTIFLMTFSSLMFLVPDASLAQKLDPSDFKSKTASRAIRDYLERGDKATKKFIEEKEDATKDLVEQLQKVLKQETADGNLDESLKIRKTISELEKNVVSQPHPSVNQLIGRWRIRYSAATAPLYYDVIQNGNQLLVKRWEEVDKKPRGDAQFFLKDNELWWTWDDGKRRDRVHFLPDGRLIIEHWYMPVANETKSFPQQFAIGEKVISSD